MISSLYALARPLIFSMDAEAAHTASIRALASGLVPSCKLEDMPRLHTKIAGLEFANPVGLAAGYDKNGEVHEALSALGFGFVEVGTVTPRPQSGNPKPRIFRLIEQEGVINRLGFNNKGHDALYNRLAGKVRSKGILGINIGANKDSEDFVADYVTGLKRFWELGDYFTANISSPNTPGLRNLQARDALKNLLDQIFEAAEQQQTETGVTRPVFLKIAPDITDEEMDDIAAVVANSPLSGLIVSNTTLSRAGVEGAANGKEAGGLSGKPLFERSTIVLARMRQRLGKELPIIGVGGVDSAEAAFQKISAGANMVQLYSAMVYHGPGLVADIVKGLEQLCSEHGFETIGEAIGRTSDKWAERPLNTG